MVELADTVLYRLREQRYNKMMEDAAQAGAINYQGMQDYLGRQQQELEAQRQLAQTQEAASAQLTQPPGAYREPVQEYGNLGYDLGLLQKRKDEEERRQFLERMKLGYAGIEGAGEREKLRQAAIAKRQQSRGKPGNLPPDMDLVWDATAKLIDKFDTEMADVAINPEKQQLAEYHGKVKNVAGEVLALVGAQRFNEARMRYRQLIEMMQIFIAPMLPAPQRGAGPRRPAPAAMPTEQDLIRGSLK